MTDETPETQPLTTHAAPTDAQPAQGPFLGGLFLVTAVMLALEVLVTRLLSVITWYSLAFLVIGMGLFGLTAGAVRVYLRPALYADGRLGAQLAKDALYLAAAIPLSYVLLLVVPLRVEPVATTALLFLLFALTISLPFLAAGAIVAASLTRSTLPVGRIYAVDLAGAALGAPLVPLLLEHLDAGSAILAMGAVAALASALYARSVNDLRGVRRALVASGVLALITAANAAGPNGLVPLWVKGRAEERSKLELETWNSHSRIHVFRPWRGPPVYWSRGLCADAEVEQRWINIDGDAGTVLYHADPSIAEMRFLACDVTSVVHQIRPRGRVAIIGVGGSRDLQTALMFGHEHVTGVELNARLLELLRSPLGAAARIADSPRVRLVHDDGRSWMTRSQEQFDVVQMSLVDTWAATGAGAHALGENGLYTVEAWRAFLARLAPGGVLSVSRWHQGGTTDETARMVALATAALLERGAEKPLAHLALVRVGLVATLLVGVDPLTPADLARLASTESRLGFETLLAPGTDGRATGKSAGFLAPIAESRTRAALDARTFGPIFDLRPPTDDRPFFFNLLRMRAWFVSLPEEAGGTIEGNRRATLTLALAFLASLVLVAAAVVVPIALRRRAEREAPRVTPAPPRGLVAAGIAYFAVIGVSFMLAEIGLLQRLGLMLGHPLYGLVVVLASLVGAAGLGSFVTDRLPLDRAPACFVPPLVTASLLFAVAWFLPGQAAELAAAPLATRIAFAAGLTATLGISLGTAFPGGMRVFGATLRDEAPWLWGINGVGGVLASSGGIILAHELGLSALFVVAACGYVLLVPLLARGVAALRGAP
jgi:hypothetical protein